MRRKVKQIMIVVMNKTIVHLNYQKCDYFKNMLRVMNEYNDHFDTDNLNILNVLNANI